MEDFKTFEIHITGEQSILKELEDKKLKTITIDLLNVDNTLFRTEYMSSIVLKTRTFASCVNFVEELVGSLKSKIIRIKIESPYYEELVPFSLYMGSHFSPQHELWEYNYPVSRNQRTWKLMATDREYNKDKYKDFINKWQGQELELCLLDSFKEEDRDWFDLYN